MTPHGTAHLLGLPRKSALVRGQLIGALSLSRACWPADGDLRAQALLLCPQGPPDPSPGDVLFATASSACGSLWALRSAPAPSVARRAALGPEAQGALRVAQAALPTALPLVWRQVRRATLSADPLLVGEVPLCGQPEAAEVVVDGASAGLAFLVRLASLALGLAPKPDCVAMATVDATGALGEVGALREKVLAIRAWAPGVTRLLVAKSQEDALARVLEGLGAAELTPVPCANAAQAITSAFGGADAIAAPLRHPRSDEEWSDLSESFVALVLEGRAGLRDWTAVQAAAAIASRTCPDHLAMARDRLLFVGAVAARHEGAAPDVTRLPSLGWIDEEPGEDRVNLIAHVVQHCTDTGEPDVEEVLALSEPYLVRGRDSWRAHLRLLGARARLLALGHRPGPPLAAQREAMALQEEAAHAWVTQRAWAESTYPLSEWFRLSGVLRDRAAWDRAEEFRVRAETRGALHGQAGDYVELGRSKAGVLLDGPGGSLAPLERLAGGESAPSHVKAAAIGLLALMDDGKSGVSGRIPSPGTWAGRLQLAQETSKDARIQWALLSLRRGATGQEAAAHLRALRDCCPGVMRHLLTSATMAQASPEAFVASLFPY